MRDLTNDIINISKEWEKIGITNDFIFCKIMQDKVLLEELIRMILPDLEFTELNITAQKSIEINRDIHGVRFDIYVSGNDGTIIDIEMQVLNQDNLPRRIRFYSSMADSDLLEKGVVYSKLKDSYIIVICSFDYYKKGFHKYTFTNRCHEVDELEMNDGTTKIVLNSLGTKEDVHGSLKEFLNYVAGKSSNDKYVKKLEFAVNKARQNKEWRREFMTLAMRDLEKIEEGRRERDREKIEDMLKKGKTVESIVDFCDYPEDLVKSIHESMLV